MEHILFYKKWRENAMEIEIKNGVTIIRTGDAKGGLKNKTGGCGITFYKEQKKYRAEININKKKMLIGFFNNKETAIKARKVAEIKKEEGVLVEWLKTKPHGNSAMFQKFWQEEFEKCGL